MLDKVQEKKTASNILCFYVTYLCIHSVLRINDRFITSSRAISPENSVLYFLFQGLVSSVFLQDFQ
jgi:hypothetical protein